MSRNHANRTFPVRLVTLLLAGVAICAPVMTAPAFALSELQDEPKAVASDQNTPPPAADPVEEEPDQEETLPLEIPMPDPLIKKTVTITKEDQAKEEPKTFEPIEVLSDVSKIPAPVARMRELIVEAAASGDIERLRPLLGKGPTELRLPASALMKTRSPSSKACPATRTASRSWQSCSTCFRPASSR